MSQNFSSSTSNLRYKPNQKKISSLEDARAIRAVEKKQEWKKLREKSLAPYRNVTNTPLQNTKNQQASSSRSTKKYSKEELKELGKKRFQEMLKWKAERRKKIEDEKRKRKPAFKTGVYHSTPLGYLSGSETESPCAKVTPWKFSNSAQKSGRKTPSSVMSQKKGAGIAKVLRFHSGATPQLPAGGTKKPKDVGALTKDGRRNSRSMRTFRPPPTIGFTPLPDTPSFESNRNRPFVSRRQKSFAPSNFCFQAPKGLKSYDLMNEDKENVQKDSPLTPGKVRKMLGLNEDSCHTSGEDVNKEIEGETQSLSLQLEDEPSNEVKKSAKQLLNVSFTIEDECENTTPLSSSNPLNVSFTITEKNNELGDEIDAPGLTLKNNNSEDAASNKEPDVDATSHSSFNKEPEVNASHSPSNKEPEVNESLTPVNKEPEIDVASHSSVNEEPEIDVASHSSVNEEPEIDVASHSPVNKEPEIDVASHSSVNEEPEIDVASHSSFNEEPEIDVASYSPVNKQPEIDVASHSPVNKEPEIDVASHSPVNKEPEIDVASHSPVNEEPEIDASHLPPSDDDDITFKEHLVINAGCTPGPSLASKRKSKAMVTPPLAKLRPRTPCSRKTRRSRSAHCDHAQWELDSVIQLSSTKKTKRKSVRIKPEMNEKKDDSTLLTEEVAGHKVEKVIEHVNTTLEKEDAAAEQEDKLVKEDNQPFTPVSTTGDRDDQVFKTPSTSKSVKSQSSRMEKRFALLNSSPWITKTRGSSSSSKDRKKGKIFSNELEAFFHNDSSIDDPADGVPEPKMINLGGSPPLRRDILPETPTHEFMQNSVDSHPDELLQPTFSELPALPEAKVWSPESVENSPMNFGNLPGDIESNVLPTEIERVPLAEISPTLNAKRGGRRRSSKRGSVSFAPETSFSDSTHTRFSVTPVRKSTRISMGIFAKAQENMEDSSAIGEDSKDRLIHVDSPLNVERKSSSAWKDRVSLLPGLYAFEEKDETATACSVPEGEDLISWASPKPVKTPQRKSRKSKVDTPIRRSTRLSKAGI